MHSTFIGPIQPWWRFHIWWLAFGGPLLVAIASFVSLFLALHGRDMPLADSGAAESSTTTPAVQARNHASRPGH
jgi:uncharacterized protein